MKKKIFIIVILITIACTNFRITTSASKICTLLTFKDVEAMATMKTACIGDPAKNIGKCKPQTGTLIVGTSSVSPCFWNDKDFYDTIIIHN